MMLPMFRRRRHTKPISAAVRVGRRIGEACNVLKQTHGGRYRPCDAASAANEVIATVLDYFEKLILAGIEAAAAVIGDLGCEIRGRECRLERGERLGIERRRNGLDAAD